MRRRRIPRPVHAALCLVVLLLIPVFFRLEYGPPAAWGEEALLRRAERQYLRAPGEVIAVWNDTNIQDFVVWDGREVQVYDTLWENNVSFYGVERTPKPKPIVHRYTRAILWRDSREKGWGCTGMVTSVWKSSSSDWVRSLPLLIKNDDPAAVRGHLTVTAHDDSESSGSIHLYVWHAEAERENPWVFLFFVTPQQRGDQPLLVMNRIANGYDYTGEITAEAEIIWYSEDGEELSRQYIDLIETEGSET